MAKIQIEIEESYKEKLDILRKVFVGAEGKELENDGELLQWLVDTFMEFLQNQTGWEEHNHWEESGWCGNGGCGCSH